MAITRTRRVGRRAANPCETRVMAMTAATTRIESRIVLAYEASSTIEEVPTAEDCRGESRYDCRRG